MTEHRVYGDAVAHSLRLTAPPTLMTRSLQHGQIGMSRFSIGPDHLGMSPRIPPEDSFIVALYLTEVAHHELWSRGRPFLRQGYAANAMRIVNLVEEFSALITCPHESLCFYLPRAVLDEFSEDAGGARIAELACTPGAIDPVLTNLGASLLPTFERPAETSALFVDHLALAVCAHLAQRYGGFRSTGPTVKGGLTARQAERSKAFMAEHCDEDILLADVARVCGLSRSYFTKAFKTTTGLTPHQWRQRYRIDKAKAMLLETSTEIAEIAMACGFADQSHLTRVFARLVGDSPASWRRRRRA